MVFLPISIVYFLPMFAFRTAKTCLRNSKVLFIGDSRIRALQERLIVLLDPNPKRELSKRAAKPRKDPRVSRTCMSEVMSDLKLVFVALCKSRVYLTPLYTIHYTLCTIHYALCTIMRHYALLSLTSITLCMLIVSTFVGLTSMFEP